MIVAGGGIAGSGLATVLARNGLDVLVLEKTTEYTDINRGEAMWPWGAVIAHRIGLLPTLRGAGAHWVPRVRYWDPGLDGPEDNDLAGLHDEAEGSLNMAHHLARQALIDEAARAGATVLRGATVTGLSTGSEPTISWTDDKGDHTSAGRLVVGADGRNSVVRRLAGIELHKYPTSHYAAGLRVFSEGIPTDVNTVSGHPDGRLLITFPQGDGHSRVYLCFPTDQKHTYAGGGAVDRFLADSAFPAVPDNEAWSGGRAAGPMSTFPCADADSHPLAPGVAVIGDAGGYNNYQIGQGLSLAMGDIECLSEVLLGTDDWTPAGLLPFAERRAESLGRVRALARLNAIRSFGFANEPEKRASAFQLFMDDEFLWNAAEATFAGFEGTDITAAQLETAVDRFEQELHAVVGV